jgi:hypothetical protein
MSSFYLLISVRLIYDFLEDQNLGTEQISEAKRHGQKKEK